METSTCGWVLSVLRAPYKTGVFPIDVTKSRSHYSLEISCKYLSNLGLDSMLGDLLYLTQESSIQDTIETLSFPNYASKVRAFSQLKYMMGRFQSYVNESTTNQLCISSGNYLISKCSDDS